MDQMKIFLLPAIRKQAKGTHTVEMLGQNMLEEQPYEFGPLYSHLLLFTVICIVFVRKSDF
jgi:hypothetical protein